MEKIMQIDLDSTDDLFERYNKDKISKGLIKYMIESTPRFKKDDTLKVVINNRLKEDISCSELIKKALDAECDNNDFRFVRTNMKQLYFFIIGIIALGVSTLIEAEILKEIILIGAWVVLWDMVELEIVDDMSNRKRKKILKKLLSSEFIENRK